MLAKVEIGWKWLKSTLNDIIDQVNRQKIIRGDGITVSDSPSGTVISIIRQPAPDDVNQQNPGSQQSGPTIPPGTYVIIPLQIQDQNCNWTTIFVLGQSSS